MLKDEAIALLGGTNAAAAEIMGVSYQAVNKWPARLPNRIAERVLGVCVLRGISIPDRFLCAGTQQAQTQKSAHV